MKENPYVQRTPEEVDRKDLTSHGAEDASPDLERIWNAMQPKLAIIDETLEALAPVSYTHLDVYKRQAVYDAVCVQADVFGVLDQHVVILGKGKLLHINPHRNRASVAHILHRLYVALHVAGEFEGINGDHCQREHSGHKNG